MRWQFPIIVTLFASMLGTALYYRTLYYDAEKARKIAVSDREKQQVAFEQLSHQGPFPVEKQQTHKHEFRTDI